MKTKFKISNRILSLVLTLVLALGMLPNLATEAHAATAIHSESGITVEVDGAYCDKCKDYKTCESASISSVSLDGEEITIYVSCNIQRHYDGSSQSYHEYGKDTIIIRYSHFKCSAPYHTNASISASGWRGQSQNNNEAFFTGGLRIRRGAGHAVSKWTHNGESHTGTCSLCGDVTEKCKYSAATCLAASACSVCKHVYEAKKDHSYTYKASGATITETCLNGCDHSETAKLEYTTGNGTYTYIGSEIKPLEVIPSGGWQGGTLDISYSANTTNVGAAKGVITKGNAKAELGYRITEANIADATVALKPTSGTYTDESHNAPTYTLTYNGKTLDDDDYTAGQWSGDLLNAGNYTLVLTGKGNFTGTKTITYTIGKANPTAELFQFELPQNATYDGATAYSANVTSNAHGLGEFTVKYNGSTDAPRNAGTYTVTVDVAEGSNYNAASGIELGSFTIAPAAAEIVISENRTVTYDGAAITAGASNADILYSYNGDSTPVVKWYADSNGAKGEEIDAPTNAGTYWIGVSAPAGNYEAVEEVTAAVTITKADPKLDAPTAKTLIYTGAAQALVTAGEADFGTMVYSLTADGEFTATIPTATGAGNYTVYYCVKGDSNVNNSAVASVFVTIEKATPEYTAEPTGIADLVYDGAPQELVNEGAVTGGTIEYRIGEGEWSTTIPTGVSAGEYPVEYRIVGDANYENVAEKSVSVTISKINPTYTAPTGLTATYGDTLADVELPDGFSWTDSSLSVGDAGSNTFTATYTPADTTNYNTVTDIPVSIEVGKADASIVWNSGYFNTYGNNMYITAYINGVDGKMITGTAVATVYDGQGNALNSVTCTKTETSGTYFYNNLNALSDGTYLAPGTYTVRLSFQGNDNYLAKTVDLVEYAIHRRALTVTANDNTITYGDAPAADGVTGNGFITGESFEDLSGELTYTYNYEQYGNVGTYAITPAGLTSDNYEITFVDGTLTVDAKPITVTANAVSKTYGDADPKLTYTAVGLVNGDELAGSLTRTSGENIGTYDIAQGTLDSGNYAISYTGATLTIHAKAITETDVKLNGSLTYNGKEQTQAITVAEGITYEVSSNKATNAGEYALTVKGTGNYTGSVDVKWSIAKAAVTITAENKVIYVGAGLPTLTYTVSGLVEGEQLTKEPTLTTNADANAAGSYTITAANADAGDNYEISYVGGTLTVMNAETEVETRIEKAELTEVPDGLKNTEFNTVEAITEELVSRILATSTGYSEENMEHYDVTLQFSLDRGKTWILATEENFPTEGITVTLPYPEGTNARDYEFVVSHMFTVTSRRLGTTAGDVELPKVEETANGIRVTLNGLSPVTVAARYHDHTGGTATCTEKAVCSICNQPYGETLPHTYGSDWKSDGTNHWHECTCGAKSEVAAHSGGTAYCTNLAQCTVCRTDYGKMDSNNHIGYAAVVIDPTCSEKGYTLHACPCGDSYKDTYVNATGDHTYGSWKVVKEATKTAKGEKQRTCSVCGHVESKEIPMITDNPATGDDSNILLWFGMLCVSALGLAVLLADRKRRKATK